MVLPFSRDQNKTFAAKSTSTALRLIWVCLTQVFLPEWQVNRQLKVQPLFKYYADFIMLIHAMSLWYLQKHCWYIFTTEIYGLNRYNTIILSGKTTLCRMFIFFVETARICVTFLPQISRQELNESFIAGNRSKSHI